MLMGSCRKGNKWDKQKMVPSSELLQRISMKYSGITKTPDELNDTARNYVIPGHLGSLGFISSMSDHFCATCNRLRVTADGQIKACFIIFLVYIPSITVLCRFACSIVGNCL